VLVNAILKLLSTLALITVSGNKLPKVKLPMAKGVTTSSSQVVLALLQKLNKKRQSRAPAIFFNIRIATNIVLF
jgi:hypothetical protein